MLKMMVFVDGSWFGAALKALSKSHDSRETLHANQVDFKPLWDALSGYVRSRLGVDVDLVRVHYVVGHPRPETVLERSRPYIQKMVGHLEELRRKDRFDIELYGFDYRNGDPYDKDPAEEGRIKEKCVDVALATRMLYYAAIPGAYDLAVLVSGDLDFAPVLRAVRRLGKRTLLASFVALGRCHRELLADTARGDLIDFDVFGLDTIVAEQLGPSFNDPR